uniref:Uncharacterized protein K02A2.6-like n=1 Tax=Nicotiana tabacum TaxID=4097 RepID=A0A1S4A0C0_TOBAC|nr:PREDICTED: uncharacterized protein K02A2.6-like [Nicotiana tabacum]
MPFGLNNAGATYQRLVNKMFKEQLGKTTEVYIDDMLVKSTKKEDHIGHLKEAFEILRQYGMKLNPEKCTFGVTSGKFLGFLVLQRGIEVNPDQIRAIEGIPEVLTSKKQERPWNAECVDALRKLKAYLSSPPILVKADPSECLLVYLAVSEVAASAVLAARYNLVNGDLYKRTFGSPLAKCLGPNQTRRVLEEIHEGHFDAHKGIRARYYWPTMKKEVANYVRRCEQCQKYAPMIHQAGELLHSVTSPWPFIKWGMDIVGPLPAGRGKVEAGAYKQIREQEVIAFIWKNLICRFGIPKEICCDNGPQFVGKKTTEFFKKWHIKQILSMPYHPASNGQAESANKVILNILNKKFEDAKGLWPELLLEVLWAYRTTPKTSTGETPYSLVYGTDVVIPIEVGEPSLRYSNESGPSNDESRLQDLDEVKERRNMDHIRMVAQKQQVESYYNKKDKVRPLKIGDYVLKAKI